jgi:hypothetical protein
VEVQKLQVDLASGGKSPLSQSTAGSDHELLALKSELKLWISKSKQAEQKLK